MHRAVSADIALVHPIPSSPPCPSALLLDDDAALAAAAAAAALSFCITKKGLTPLPLSMNDLPDALSALLSICCCDTNNKKQEDVYLQCIVLELFVNLEGSGNVSSGIVKKHRYTQSTPA
jgi:hypothetical protein